jgi:hypothetical protein
MSNPVSDEAAIAATRTLIAYHEHCARYGVLDIIHEYHADFVERLRTEIEQIPERTAAAKRADERYAER